MLSGELKHQPACLGAYTLVAGRAVHGRPVWRHERGDRCIAKLASGRWAVQKEENVGVQMVSAFCACLGSFRFSLWSMLKVKRDVSKQKEAIIDRTRSRSRSG